MTKIFDHNSMNTFITLINFLIILKPFMVRQDGMSFCEVIFIESKIDKVRKVQNLPSFNEMPLVHVKYIYNTILHWIVSW